MNLQQQLVSAELKGIGIGVAVGAVVVGAIVLFILEAQPQPTFSCPKGIQIIIEDRVLVHSPNSPDTAYCAIPRMP